MKIDEITQGNVGNRTLDDFPVAAVALKGVATVNLCKASHHDCERHG
jgi:hypothetical protein